MKQNEASSFVSNYLCHYELFLYSRLRVLTACVKKTLANFSLLAQAKDLTNYSIHKKPLHRGEYRPSIS